jgi:energy-coupling factor transporter ATP-binding protein EcfA2
MRLHSVKTQNFMSMRDCCMNNLDSHMNFIVGPNGSGKSTIFRVLQTIREAFRAQGTDSLDMGELCTHGVNPQALDVTISVEFDMPWEQNLITAFLCASFSYPDFLRQSVFNQHLGMSDEQDAAFSGWLLDVLTAGRVSFLFHGDLRLTYRSGVHEYLRLSYTFACSDEPMTITAGMPAAFIDGGLWKGLPPETHLNSPPSEHLLAAFLGRRSQLDELVRFLTSQSNTGPSVLDAAGLFLYLAESRGWLIARKVQPRYAHVPAYKYLSDLSSEPMYQTYTPMPGRPAEVFTFSHLIYLLLRRALIFSTDLHMPLPTRIGLSEQSATSTGTLINVEQQLPLLLFHLKNGNPAQRERYKRIQRSFETITGQKFDLNAKTEIQVDGDQGTQRPVLIIDPRIIDAYSDISLRYHGAGIKEALVLATLLDESEGCLVLLDEPTANLHAGMQHKLLEVLREAPSQVIVVTHSAHVLPTKADEFLAVRRMQKRDVETQIMSMGNSVHLTPEKLERELSISSDVAGLLFANGVILVEGQTEVGAFSAWFPQSTAGQGKSFADLNIVVYSVDGKTNFPFYLRFLTTFGVPWAVICDGDAFPPATNTRFWDVLMELKLVASLPQATSFANLKAEAEKAGVYTANTSSTSPDREFEEIPTIKLYIANNRHIPGGSTVRRGRYIAQNIPCPKEVNEVLQHALKHLLR